MPDPNMPRPPISVLFQPRADITTHELAQIVRGFLLFQPITILAEKWDTIPPPIRRHLALREEVLRIAAHEFIDGSFQCAHCGVTRAQMDEGTAPPCPGTAKPQGAAVAAQQGQAKDNGHVWAYDNTVGESACTNCGLLWEVWKSGDLTARPCAGPPLRLVPRPVDAGEGGR